MCQILLNWGLLQGVFITNKGTSEVFNQMRSHQVFITDPRYPLDFLEEEAIEN